MQSYSGIKWTPKLPEPTKIEVRRIFTYAERDSSVDSDYLNEFETDVIEADENDPKPSLNMTQTLVMAPMHAFRGRIPNVNHNQNINAEK